MVLVTRHRISMFNLLHKFILTPDTLLCFVGSHSSSNLLEPRNGAGYSAQNLYVQPPTRGQFSPDPDKSSNLAPRSTGRSRGPLMDVSLSQLDRPVTPAMELDPSGPPPRPALPRPEGESIYLIRGYFIS
jgi:tight junction protein 1